MKRPEPGRRIARGALIVLIATAVGFVHGGDQYRLSRLGSTGPGLDWWTATWPNLVTLWTWAALYPAAAFLCRRWPLSRPLRARALAAHVVGAALLVFVVLVVTFLAVRFLALGRVGLADLLGPWFRRRVVVSWRFHLITYGLVLAAAAGVEAGRRARAAALRVVELRTRLARARLETLRAQLHPHFMFNTLNGVLPLIGDDPEAAVRTVEELSALLRESLADGAPFADVSGEVRFLERYLGLLKLRFGERLDYSLRVAADAASGVIPRLLLQPLVENAVQHGLGRRAEGGRVEVEASRAGGSLVLEVRDDGPGLTSAPDREGGLGLVNTRARLEALHPGRFSFVVDPRPGGGVVARIVLPFEAAA